MKKSENFTERRKHARLPIIHGIVEPVDLAFEDPAHKGKPLLVPAIMSNLSAGGMRLTAFAEPPKNGMLDLHLELPGLGKTHVKGRIPWIKGKGGVYTFGIAFTEISHAACEKINAMAEDYYDCETRIELRLPEVCVPNCKCQFLCNKPQKDEELFSGAKETKGGKK